MKEDRNFPWKFSKRDRDDLLIVRLFEIDVEISFRKFEKIKFRTLYSSFVGIIEFCIIRVQLEDYFAVRRKIYPNQQFNPI